MTQIHCPKCGSEPATLSYDLQGRGMFTCAKCPRKFPGPAMKKPAKRKGSGRRGRTASRR